MSMTRQYLLEQIDDAAVVQLYADGFSALPLDQKVLAWHLYQAARAGRDIWSPERSLVEVFKVPACPPERRGSSSELRA